jgi:hypothetical protein
MLCAAAIAAFPANAAVVSGALTGGTALSSGGVFQIIANPSGLTVGNNNFQNNNVRVFNEAQNVVLAGPLAVDVVAGNIAAGTRVSSHYLNFDPGLGQTTAIGSVSFSTPILGVITTRTNLVGSLLLGAAGVTYLHPTLVGLEPAVDTIGFSGNTLTFDFETGVPGDSIRIITAGVPEPASWAMLIAGFGLVGAASRRRRTVAA